MSYHQFKSTCANCGGTGKREHGPCLSCNATGRIKHGSFEVFYAEEGHFEGGAAPTLECAGAPKSASGWYWWTCFPGCMPEGDANGPFKTERAAEVDALSQED
jgi:hypothetical protein